MTQAELKSSIEASLLAYFAAASQESNKDQPQSWHATQMANAIGASVHAYCIDLATTTVSSHSHDIADPG